MACQTDHDLLSDHLNRSRQIHVELTEFGFPLSRWPAEQLVEFPACHPEAAVELEITQIQPKRAIRLDINQVCFDLFDEARLAIGR